MKQGLVEWALVTAFLALAAAGAAHFLGDEIRAVFGIHGPEAARVGPAAGAPTPRAP
jgi:hypothetical protein